MYMLFKTLIIVIDRRSSEQSSSLNNMDTLVNILMFSSDKIKKLYYDEFYLIIKLILQLMLKKINHNVITMIIVFNI